MFYVMANDKFAKKRIKMWLQGCNWQKNMIYVEKNNEGIRVTGPRSKLKGHLKHLYIKAYRRSDATFHYSDKRHLIQVSRMLNFFS